MMIFNPKKAIPLVDAGNVHHSDRVTAPEDRARIRQNELVERRKRQQFYLMQQAQQKRLEHEAAVRAHKQNAMLQRSLKQKPALMGAKHSFGSVPQFGNSTPLMGFTDEARDADYSQQEVIPAQEFNNALACKDFADYTKFKDYPLVLDAPAGDFGGVLVNEKGSPDFAALIVNDVRQDSGAVPRRRRK